MSLFHFSGISELCGFQDTEEERKVSLNTYTCFTYDKTHNQTKIKNVVQAKNIFLLHLFQVLTFATLTNKWPITKSRATDKMAWSKCLYAQIHINV